MNASEGQFQMDAQRLKSLVAMLSIASNTVLIIVKLSVGLLIGSVSVVSEAIHSGVDLFASVIAFVSIRESSRPADQSHPFGHGKIENISGTVEALLIFLAAAWILYESVGKTIRPERMETAGLGVAVMFLSASINLTVSHFLFKIGKMTDSIALQADAWHLRTDVYTSAGVMAGLGFMLAGQTFFPHLDFTWVDPVCAVAVALLIIKAAYDLTRASARDLLDANLPEEEEWIRNFLFTYRPTIKGYHYLRTRKAGYMRFIEFHIQVDSQMTVSVSHDLARELTHMIKDHVPHSTVTIHIEPCTGDCNDKCRAGCLLTDGERAEMESKTFYL